MDIYVGNLPITVEKEQLEKLFKSYGTVFAINMPKDRNTGSSRGIAFVKMPYMNEALEAIQHLNGTELDGKKISVKRAYDKNSYKKQSINFRRAPEK